MKIDKNKYRLLTFLVILGVFSNYLYFQTQNTVTAEFNFSKAECVMEKESRRILYEYNGETCLPMASTTKIATAITVLENCDDLKTPFTIPKAAVGIDGSSIYLQEGDCYSTEELLYGLMLRSGNDAATALAIKIAGNVEEFNQKMNETAKIAGALHTNFKNPHGLPCDGHYTTARDLSYLTCYALHNTKFEEIVATKYYKPRNWTNKNKMLTLYPFSIGVKTGYTKEAGRCLVSAAKKEDMTLVCSVLSSADMYNRSIELLNSCFERYKKTKLLDKNDEISLESKGKLIKATSKTDFSYPLCEGELEHVEIITTPIENKSKKWLSKKKKEEICGKIEIYLLKRLIFSGNLYKL